MRPSDFIYSKFVTTIVLIIPVTSIDEFLGQYELWTENVIPKSARKLGVPEKDGLTIWKINLFNVDVSDEEPEQRFDHDDHDHKQGMGKKEKKKLTPFQEFSEKARERLKIVSKEFKFEAGLS